MISLHATTEGEEARISLHPGQIDVLQSDARITLALAGTQGGKTVVGPLWLHKTIQRLGPGDYIAATPSFTLLEKKALPEFQRYFEQVLRCGSYVGGSKRTFTVDAPAALFGDNPVHMREALRTPTRVMFGHASDPEALESMTAKAAWLDEAGQKRFKLGSWEALQRRLAVHDGPSLITTTPYSLGWLKTEVHDRADGRDIRLINFRSVDNPTFPLDVWRRAKRTLPAWKFDMFYRGIFARPAGAVYDCFDESRHVVKPFKIPLHWRIFVGLDFGAVNAAAMLYAKDPQNGRLFAFAEYHPGVKRTIEQHARRIRSLIEQNRTDGSVDRVQYIGGAPSEDQWRKEFRQWGLSVARPRVSEVEVGIDRVYRATSLNLLFTFNTLRHYLSEKRSYTREVDDEGVVTDKIEDKETFHLMDAERYALTLAVTDREIHARKIRM